MRLDLPGGWAEIVDPRRVTERKRRRYIAAMSNLSAATAELPRVPNPNAGDPGQDVTMADSSRFAGAHMELADRVSDALILCLVAEWSFGPVDEATIEELPAEAFDPLFKACRELAPRLLPDYSPDIDPKAPTGAPTRPPPASPTATSTYATLTSDGTG